MTSVSSAAMAEQVRPDANEQAPADLVEACEAAIHARESAFAILDQPSQ